MTETDDSYYSVLAEQIAREAHHGQKRKLGDDKGKDYIVHPERIASKFTDHTLKTIAWLHDVIEDTPFGVSELYHLGFSKHIIDSILSLTKLIDENYFDFIIRVSKDSDARLVKIEDLKDNMTSLEEGSLKDKYRFALHYLELCVVLSGECGRKK